MTLTCTLRDKSTKVVVVPISPPLRGYEDVKPRLLEMKAKAQEGLGMVGSSCSAFAGIYLDNACFLD